MNPRLQKQITVIAIPAAAIIIIVVSIFTISWIFSREKVIPVEEPEYINTITREDAQWILSNGLYDYIIYIKNPNSNYALSSFKYSLKTQEKTLKSGEGHLMPAERKALIIKNIEMTDTEKVMLEFSDFVWKEKKDNIGTTTLSVKNVQIKETSFSGLKKLYIEGEVQNLSSYDLEETTINILIKNSSDEIIAVNFSTVNQLEEKKKRKFKAEWTNLSVPSNHTLDIEAYSNFYNKDNLLY